MPYPSIDDEITHRKARSWNGETPKETSEKNIPKEFPSRTHLLQLEPVEKCNTNQYPYLHSVKKKAGEEMAVPSTSMSLASTAFTNRVSESLFQKPYFSASFLVSPTSHHSIASKIFQFEVLQSKTTLVSFRPPSVSSSSIVTCSRDTVHDQQSKNNFF